MLTALLALGLALGASRAHAQSPVQDWPAVDVQVVTGSRNAIIEGTCSSGRQSMVGASLRYHSERGMAAGIEMVYVRPCASQAFTYYHPQMSVMLQAIRDLGRFSRVRPYVVGGGGIVRHRSRFAPPSEGVEFAGGLGVNVRLHRHIVVSPEFQVGGPVLFSRFTLSAGFMAR